MTMVGRTELIIAKAAGFSILVILFCACRREVTIPF